MKQRHDTSENGYLLAVDEPLEPGGRVRLGRGAVEDEAVADPVVAQAAADHGASVQQLCKKQRWTHFMVSRVDRRLRKAAEKVFCCNTG